MVFLRRMLAVIAVLTLAATAILAIALSYDAPCPTGTETAVEGPVMRSARYACYGGPDVVQLTRQPVPSAQGKEFLVRVEKAAVNPLDWHFLRGSPYIMRLASGIGRPEERRLGRDFSGVVEAVGPEVSRFQVGDAVFGGATGAFSDYVILNEGGAVAHKPASLSHTQAAALPIAGVTALQAVRDKGRLQAGERVLINGASGGVGSFAVQIAKAMGATVTGVCSGRNAARVRALGADAVIDYTREDYTQGSERYDLIIDNVGNHSVLANRRALAPGGRMVMVAGGHGDWLGPFLNPLLALPVAPFVEQEFSLLLAHMRVADLEALAEMTASGELKPLIDRHYPLADVAAALAYSESGRARGKIILDTH